MILTILLLIFLFALLAAIALVIFARWNYGVLESAGIPVIKPKLFLGSVPDLHKRVQTAEDIRRFQEYGSIWGLYEGRTPTIYVCDPELIRLIFVKDLEYFFDRRINHFSDPRIDEILDYLPGEKWRKMRKLQTVLFSSGKIKQYNANLAAAAYDFVDRLNIDCAQDGFVKIDTRRSMDILSLDGIARVSFGIKLENVDDPKNAFFNALKKLLGEGQRFTWLYSLSMVFPFLTKFAPSFQIDDVLFDTFKEILETRRQERSHLEPDAKCNDLADLLADSYAKLDTPEYQKLQITEMTLLAQALNVTALDMISATMTMMSYYLAQNPEIQAKLHAEIDEVLIRKHGGLINNETVNELSYLTACINETLRLAPPLIRPERECSKDWSSPDGSIKIKRGTVVMVPLWAAHRNPEYFPDPEKFHPERFIDGANNPYAFSPFGLGIRDCIGKRLAYETLKVNMCIILKDYSYRWRPDTRLGFKPGVLYLLQFHPMYLDLVRRNQ